MNEQVKSQWVEALRSGKYSQGTAFLGYEGKHCALGVLCEVLDIPNTSDEWAATEYDGYCSMLPASARTKAGMLSSMGVYSDVTIGKLNTVVALNNTHNFSEVADVIEKVWSQL